MADDVKHEGKVAGRDARAARSDVLHIKRVGLRQAPFARRPKGDVEHARWRHSHMGRAHQPLR
jgi:hypothetical protein